MRKLIALAMVLLVVISCVAVLPVGAADAAKTEVSVNKGDEVIYTLSLADVPEKVVGCDFSIYFDSSEYKVKEYADFTDSFDPDEQRALINPNLAGELRGNWSILSGVAFRKKRNVVTVKLEALKKADTHISYYVRYLYPESMEQFTQYTFTCNVQVNKTTVIDNEAPELNVEEEQPNGEFVNSVTGKSDDAQVNMAEQAPNAEQGGSNGGEANENSVSKPNSASSGKTTPNKNSTSTSSKNEGETPTDEEAEILDPASASEAEGGSPSVWLWIVLAVIVIGAGVGVAFYLTKKKAQ